MLHIPKVTYFYIFYKRFQRFVFIYFYLSSIPFSICFQSILEILLSFYILCIILLSNFLHVMPNLFIHMCFQLGTSCLFQKLHHLHSTSFHTIYYALKLLLFIISDFEFFGIYLALIFAYLYGVKTVYLEKIQYKISKGINTLAESIKPYELDSSHSMLKALVIFFSNICWLKEKLLISLPFT